MDGCGINLGQFGEPNPAMNCVRRSGELEIDGDGDGGSWSWSEIRNHIVGDNKRNCRV